jgi:uncharacterized membrane protein
MSIIGLGGIGATRRKTDQIYFKSYSSAIAYVLEKTNERGYEYDDDSKTSQTVAVKMKYAGFTLDNKHAFYVWSKMNPSKSLVYFSKTSLNSNISSGKIK